MPRWIWAVLGAVAIATIAVQSAALMAKPQTVTITRTIIHTIKITPKPRVIIRHRTQTLTITDPAETNCIANLWHSYVALANGGPAGDPSLFQYDCPGVHINGLTG